MDLTTSWLGLELRNPIIAGACPLSDSVDTVRRLEDAGAAAVVLQSLMEEEIRAEELSFHHHIEGAAESFGEALSYFPEMPTEARGVEAYLSHVEALKRAVDIPVIASLNGASPGGWLRYAKRMEEAGADAIELNVYFLAMDLEDEPPAVERRYLDVLEAVRAEVEVPLAMKLSPWFTAFPAFARRLTAAGANGLVLFNRFYQPDIDIERLEASAELRLSDSSELLLRLRWLAALHGRVPADLACTGGVHTPVDVVKALMAGASVVQMASALLRNGPDYLRTVHDQLVELLETLGYAEIGPMIGSMSLQKAPDPDAFTRANYRRLLRGWHIE